MGSGVVARRSTVQIPEWRLPRTAPLGSTKMSMYISSRDIGQVYAATDINLARQVAIKVLPDAVAADADRLARFDREARTLASLNHPNIALIYGIEHTGGTTALVMELVEGMTLADRIAGSVSQYSDDGALPIARQIAEALEASLARERGDHSSRSQAREREGAT